MGFSRKCNKQIYVVIKNTVPGTDMFFYIAINNPGDTHHEVQASTRESNLIGTWRNFLVG